MTNVELYRELLGKWQAARAAAGGTLTDDEEESWVERCNDVWMAMTPEEQEEAFQAEVDRM